jgi:hypothetical protein
MNDVQLDVSLPAPLNGASAVWLYAPTLYPPGLSCIEVTQIHGRTLGTSATMHRLGWWDWCESYSPQTPEGRFVVDEYVTDQAFKDKYVRLSAGEPTVTVSITTPNLGATATQCWYGMIYNYQLGGWEQKVARCPAAVNYRPNASGWTMWESKNLVDNERCVTIPSIRANWIMLAHPQYSTWVPFTDYPADYSLVLRGPCWSTGRYTFSTPAAGDMVAPNSWQAYTPYP